VPSDIVISLFLIAVGFVCAGILSSFYQLVRAEPARFDVEGDSVLEGLGRVMLLMFAGPAILMRNAIRGRMIEHRPLGWLAASAAIAGAWSLCSGAVVFEFILAFRDSVFS
jgi:hypothetical protein